MHNVERVSSGNGCKACHDILCFFLSHLVPKLRQLLERTSVVSKGLLAQLDADELLKKAQRSILNEDISRTDLALVEGLRLDLPLLLQTVHNILVAPANFVRQSLDCAELPARLESQDPQCLGNYHALLAIVWWGDTLIQLQTLKSSCATGSLVGSHSTDGSEEDFGRGAVMEGARLFRVDNMALVEEVVIAQLQVLHK